MNSPSPASEEEAPQLLDAAAATPAPPEPLSMSAVLKISMLRRLWYAQIISVFGDFLALFAVISILTFKLNATAQQITGVQISYMLPIAVLGIMAGVFVDRWPLKPTMVSSDSIRAILCLLLIFATRTWHFYAILASISVVSSFFSPAQGVAIRSAVPLHGLRSANALMQQVMFGMRIIGPSIAAFMVASFGAKSCYIMYSSSFVGSALLIATVPFIKKSTTAPKSHEPHHEASALAKIFHDMKQGFNFIFHHAALLFVILAMAAGMFVLGCFGPLIAVYVRDSLHASTKSFGVVAAMIGLGMLLGINGLNTFGKKLGDKLLVYSGLCGIAVGLPSSSPCFPTSGPPSSATSSSASPSPESSSPLKPSSSKPPHPNSWAASAPPSCPSSSPPRSPASSSPESSPSTSASVRSSPSAPSCSSSSSP